VFLPQKRLASEISCDPTFCLPFDSLNINESSPPTTWPLPSPEQKSSPTSTVSLPQKRPASDLTNHASNTNKKSTNNPSVSSRMPKTINTQTQRTEILPDVNSTASSSPNRCSCQDFISCDEAGKQIEQIEANLVMTFQKLNNCFTIGNNMKIKDADLIDLSNRVSADLAQCDILYTNHFLSWKYLHKTNRLSKELCGLAQFLQSQDSLPILSVNFFPSFATKSQKIYFPVVLTIYHSPNMRFSVHNLKLLTRNGDSMEDILQKSPHYDIKIVPVNECSTRILIKDLILKFSTKLMVAELLFCMDVSCNKTNAVYRLEAKKAVSSIIIANKIQWKKAFIELLQHTLQTRNMKRDIQCTPVYDCINLLELVLHEVFGIPYVHPKGWKRMKRGDNVLGMADIIGMEGENHRPFSWIERKFLWDLFTYGNPTDQLEMLSRFEMVHPVDKNLRVYMKGGVWMLDRSHASLVLDGLEPGTFCLRFSRNSENAICIAYVNRFHVVRHRILSKEQSKDLRVGWKEYVKKLNLRCALCVNKDGKPEGIHINDFIPFPLQPVKVHRDRGNYSTDEDEDETLGDKKEQFCSFSSF